MVMDLLYRLDGGEKDCSKGREELPPAQGSCWRSRGQVLPLLIVGLTVLWAALAVSFSLGRDVVERIKLQMVADLAAEDAACVLADGLNFMATSNLAMLSFGLAAFFGQTEAIEAIRTLQKLQDVTAQVAGGAALAKAEFIAGEHGLVAIPLNYITGSALPSLMVGRAYMGSTPLWMEDRFHSTEMQAYGERFVRLLVRKESSKRLGKHQPPAQMAVSEAAAWGHRILGDQIFFPLPVPNYRAGLVEIKCNLSGVLP
jgi:hypothetical protein